MTFLAPIFLVGLVALLVPIVIHLWSKNTRTSVGFGSLRFLRETETRTMRSIMPNQLWLLLLRLLLLTLLVLLLARPLFEEKPRELKTLYLIDTRYANTPFLAQLIDTLSDQNDARWMAMDFPDITEKVPANSADHWQVLAQKPTVVANRTVVFSPLLLKDFSGERKSFPVHYEWMSLPTDQTEEVSFSYAKNNEKWAVRTTFNDRITRHTLEPIDAAEPLKITYSIYSDDEFTIYEEVFEAAISSLNALSPLTIERVADDGDWRLWFSGKEAPVTSKLIRVSKDEIQSWREVTETHISLSPNWTKETAIAEQLPHRLLTVFAASVAPDLSGELLRMDEKTFDYNFPNDDDRITTKKEASSYLWMIFLVVFLLERWLSHKSDRR